MERLGEIHRSARGKLQAQQAEAADNQARDAVRQQRADALAEAAEAADAVLRRQPDQGIEAPGGGAEAQLQGAGAGAEDILAVNANSEDIFPKLQLAAAAPQAHPRRPWKRVINAPLRREQRVFYSMDGTQVRVGSHLDPVVAIARSIGVRREFVQIQDCTYIVTYEGVACCTSFVLPPGACELCGLELGLDAGHVLREGEFGTMQWAADQGSGGSLAKLAETISKD